MRKNKNLVYVTLPVCLSIVVAGAWFVRAGSLTPPPGPVSSTMVTLDDLMAAVTAIGGGGGGGARTPIDTLPFTILAPGSYVVTADLVSAGGAGITVSASDVTIDLNGFEMAGAMAGIGEDAIVLDPGFDNVTIFNGSIHDWGGDGIDLSAGMGHRIHDVTVESCGENGVLLGSNSRLSDCIVRLNAGDGIAAVDNNRIVNTVATMNGALGGGGLGGGDGIYLGGINNTLAGCVLESNFDDGAGVAFVTNTAHDCTAEANGFGSGAGMGFFGIARLTDCSASINASDGFFLTDGIAINCVANNNVLNGFDVAFSTVSDCEARFNGDNGILALQSRIRDNNATDNASDGIEGADGNFISGNNCNANLANGILITAPFNTVENNHCVANTLAGIDTTAAPLGSANAIFANRASGSLGGIDFLFDLGGNTFGPIVFGPGPVAGAYNDNIAY